MSSVEQAGAQLAGVVQQPASLAAAVAAGELWMEAGVAERAAQRCDQAVEDIDQWVSSVHRLTQSRKFGANEDGDEAADRFATAAQEYINTIRNAQRVFANMAATYRAAGRTINETDSASEQMFRSWFQ
ncbi:MAG: hypothetical protein JO281_15330 [Pseudonocardiales bacterium]|nr:hypothetical protein [Pseudonocardiales bacterium]